ncbi:MAG: hypothetical protein ACI8R8_002578, partial [Paraglaciecola sp.]
MGILLTGGIEMKAADRDAVRLTIFYVVTCLIN